MKRFSDFGIAPTVKSFVGDKIKMDRILNKEIHVLDFKIENSKFDKGTGKCLYLQIQMKEEKYVVFSGSSVLIDTINRVPKDDFPFATTILKTNDYFEFT